MGMGSEVPIITSTSTLCYSALVPKWNIKHTLSLSFYISLFLCVKALERFGRVVALKRKLTSLGSFLWSSLSRTPVCYHDPLPHRLTSCHSLYPFIFFLFFSQVLLDLSDSWTQGGYLNSLINRLLSLWTHFHDNHQVLSNRLS